MNDKLSDHEPTHEVMDALKEVLDAYAASSSHDVNYSMTEDLHGSGKFRVIEVRVRVPVR